tara:strand:- start:53 stop:565 length:513 start_codon:yes stop_codon:yes gene_type:complete
MSTLSVDTIQGKTTASNIAMPSGFVVQSKLHQFNTETTVTSETFTDIGGSSFTFTPRFSTSKLHLRFDVSFNVTRSSSAGTGGSLRMLMDGSNVTGVPTQGYNFYVRVNSGDLTDVYCPYSFETEMSATNTNAKTIKLQARVFTASNSAVSRVNQGNYYYSTIKIQEISQ